MRQPYRRTKDRTNWYKPRSEHVSEKVVRFCVPKRVKALVRAPYQRTPYGGPYVVRHPAPEALGRR